MAQWLAVQHILQGPSLLPKDRSINTFHLHHVTAGDANYPNVALAIRGFYSNAAGGNAALETFMQNAWLVNGHTVKIYDMIAPLHSPPVYSATLPAVGSTSAIGGLPAEVAAALSYRCVSTTADPTGTDVAGSRPQERKQGRLYLGPLSTSALSPGNVGGADGTTGDTRPNPALNAALRTSAQSCFNQLFGYDCEWSVYSKRNSGGRPLPPSMSVITEFSTDDAWDTQRRRGAQPTGRIRVGAMP